MNFEIYYNNSGHGGPYSDLIMAEQRAKDLMIGDKSQTLTAEEVGQELGGS